MRKIQPLPSWSTYPRKPIWKVSWLHISIYITFVKRHHREQTGGCQGTETEGRRCHDKGIAQVVPLWWDRLHLGYDDNYMNLYVGLNCPEHPCTQECRQNWWDLIKVCSLLTCPWREAASAKPLTKEMAPGVLPFAEHSALPPPPPPLGPHWLPFWLICMSLVLTPFLGDALLKPSHSCLPSGAWAESPSLTQN